MSVWCCGGGANGGTGAASFEGSGTYPGYGGAGAYCAQYSGTIAEGTYTVQIAARNGASSFGTLLSTPVVSGKIGGTGGGSNGTGDGIIKYPFGDTTSFYPHCGGGGGGIADRYDTWAANGHNYVYGGNGGTNGSDGGSGNGATGGDRGGGNGGTANGSNNGYATNGGSATFYGSGGGGGGSWGSSQWTGSAAGGGSGYQGVMYIRVPQNPKAVDTGYRYYRLNMQRMKRASAFSPYFSVAEFALYSGDAAISYSGASFTASSSLSGYEAAKAFDGSSTTLWHVDGNPSSAWLQVELSQAAKATSFALTMRSDQNDRLDAFLLEGSNDGTNYTQLCIATDAANGWTQGGTKTFLV